MGNFLGCCLCSTILSCCGRNKSSSIPPGANSGRTRSVLLLIFSICIALVLQYVFVPEVVRDTLDNNVADLLFNGYVLNCWKSGCKDFETEDLIYKCSGYTGVYRSGGCAFLFFLIATVAVYYKANYNRDFWALKYFLYCIVVIATIFIPNDPLFNPIIMNVMRAGAVMFIIFEQLVIIDLAYNFNETWVEKANKAEDEEGDGAGKKFLGLLLAGSFISVTCSLVAIGFMYHYFAGCDTNTSFITFTLVLGILSIAVQMRGEESSLFTSSAIFGYATYILFTAVSKNPNKECNPRLGKEDTVGIVLGISIAVISLAWVGFSSTAYKSVGDESDDVLENEREEPQEENTTVRGLVIAEDYGTLNAVEEKTKSDNDKSPRQTFSNSWKMNIILALICCWYSMILTNWGLVESEGNSANIGVGEVSMWMIISSQWLMMVLYLWTLVAPMLFPDRDFS